MAGKSATYIIALQKLIFQNDATASPITALGTGLSAAGTAGSLYVTLHTADPTSGTAATSEVSYTGYSGAVRPAVARSTSGFAVNGTTGAVTPVATISFPACTGGTATATYFSITTNQTVGNTSPILYAGTVTPNISISSGVTPQLTTSSSITEA